MTDPGVPEVRHRWLPDHGIVCGRCYGNNGIPGEGPERWLCVSCGQEAPVDDLYPPQEATT